MLKVYIADDEKGIRTLLQHIIEWDKLSLTMIGSSDNGLDALDEIIELHPDIVITDIQMYGLNGLDLIQKVRGYYEDLHFIIISGYQFFEYAHTAIKYGVDDFVLKPISKKEINDVLGKIANNIKKEALSNSVSVQDSRNNIRESFLNIFITDTTKTLIEQVNTKYHYDFKEGIFSCCIIKLDCKDVRNDFLEHMYSQIKEHIYQSIKKLYIELYYEKQVFFNNNNLIFIVNYPENQKNLIYDSYERLFQTVQMITRPYKIINSSFAIGLPVNDIKELHHSFISATHACKSRLQLGCNRIIHASSLLLDGSQIDHINFNYTSIENSIELLDSNMVYNGLKQQIHLYEPYLTKYPYNIIPVATELYNLYSIIIRRYFPNVTLISTDVFKNQLETMFTKEDIWKCLSDTIINTIVCIQGEKRDDISRTLNKAKQFIDENYSKEIGLNEVAKELYLNPNYFSALFKKESGINFHNYLTSVRMNKAKVLLKEKRYNIQEISEMVGYKDTKHFSKLFKKEVGLNPSDYRKINWLYNGDNQ